MAGQMPRTPVAPWREETLDLIRDVHLSWHILRDEVDRRLRIAVDEDAAMADRCRAAAWLAVVSQTAAALEEAGAPAGGPKREAQHLGNPPPRRRASPKGPRTRGRWVCPTTSTRAPSRAASSQDPSRSMWSTRKRTPATSTVATAGNRDV